LISSLLLVKSLESVLYRLGFQHCRRLQPDHWFQGVFGEIIGVGSVSPWFSALPSASADGKRFVFVRGFSPFSFSPKK
jgi:hypothetical protein